MSERPPPASSNPGAAEPADIRISTLIGDRLCIKCGYNLVGQPILRERHYDMLIIRCPECATVASVQEYPVLGRWANRWAAVLAGLWMLFLIALWMGSSAAIFGFAIGTAEMASDSYGDYIYDLYSQWQMQQQQQSGTTASAATPGQTVIIGPSGTRIVTSNTTDFMSWWKAQDRATLLRDVGGLFSGFNLLVWYLWMWLAITATVIGVIWATILIARGRGGRLLWGAIIIFTAAVIGLAPTMEWLSRSPTWTHQAAASQIAPLMMALTLLWSGFWLGLGLIVGRSISRGLIRLMLPPRMRSSLAFLWLTDGLEPPTASTQTLKR